MCPVVLILLGKPHAAGLPLANLVTRDGGCDATLARLEVWVRHNPPVAQADGCGAENPVRAA